MIDLHFISPTGLNRSELGSGLFESGVWNVSDERADESIGGRIYLHQRQNDVSWDGGTIQAWRSNSSGKKIFVYRADGDAHVRCSEGWGQEQATVRYDAADERMFWLTFKPLERGSPAGWPREKLQKLVADFRTDPAGTTEWWRVAAHKVAREGDGVLLFKQGNEPRGIFGRGVIVGAPQERADTSGGDDKKWRVEVRFTDLVDPEDTLLLSLDEIRDTLALVENRLVNAQASGTRVPPVIAAEIVSLLERSSESLRNLGSNEADDGLASFSETTDERERALRAICVRRGQNAFRAALIDAYGGRCVITGCSVRAVLEAAHIEPYKGPKTNDVTNGLLLRTDLHTLFDCRMLAIDPKSRTVVTARDLEGSSYAKLQGRRIRDANPLSHGPTQKGLARAFASFAKSNADLAH